MNTACALDCYDACRIDDKSPLCALVNREIKNAPRIESPRVDGVEVSMQEGLDAVVESFRDKSSLLWRGSGNVGVMQEITNLFMEQIKGTLTEGSLCDGAGDAGIVNGRGVNRTLPLEQIQKADTIVVWGRNLTVTNAHILPHIKDKNLVVIDPIKTHIAKMADLHLQIEPRSDYFVALMLARFIFMEDSQDIEWLEEFGSEYEEFYEYSCEYRIKSILDYIGTDLGEMGRVLNFLRDQKVVFLVGTGVQKYSTGASVLEAIDSLASVLGLFGKEGCGVSYLGNSKLGFDNPFEVSTNCISKVDTPFEKFDTVLVQGGNPAESMPNSNRVKESLESVENLIYFGLYENETSKLAKIVIPAKNFFEKDDIRLSYSDYSVKKINKIQESEIGIDEYQFTKYLFEAFGFDGLKSEKEYIDFWLNQCSKNGDEYISPAYQSLPYSDGFGENGGDEFVFIEDYDDDFIDTKQFTKSRKRKQKEETEKEYWLISPKSSKSLNTQFKLNDKVKLHPDLGYSDGDRVKISSLYGEVELVVENSKDIHLNSLLITNNTKGVNNLTPPMISEYGNSACFQEVKVTITSI
ncbi:MAG: molybdopterin-dependent oxidoreductase [Sulfurovum sp.]